MRVDDYELAEAAESEIEIAAGDRQTIHKGFGLAAPIVRNSKRHEVPPGRAIASGLPG